MVRKTDSVGEKSARDYETGMQADGWNKRQNESKMMSGYANSLTHCQGRKSDICAGLSRVSMQELFQFGHKEKKVVSFLHTQAAELLLPCGAGDRCIMGMKQLFL